MRNYIWTYQYVHEGVEYYFNAPNRKEADAKALAMGLSKSDFVCKW